MNELDGERELNRLSRLLEGSAIDAGVISSVLTKAAAVAKQFPSSQKIARLHDAISQRAARHERPAEPTSRIEAFRRQLALTPSLPGIQTALKAGGFASAPPDYLELKHLEDALEDVLESIWEKYSTSRSQEDHVVWQRIGQLNELLSVLPQSAAASRGLVSGYVAKLRERVAESEFVTFQDDLRSAVRLQQFFRLDSFAEAMTRWTRDGRPQVELAAAQEMLQTLQALKAVVAESELFAKDLGSWTESRVIEEGPREVSRIEREVHRVGLNDQASLRAAAGLVTAKLEKELSRLAAVNLDDATEQAVSENLDALGALDGRVQALPERLRPNELSNRCADLIRDRATRLNRLRLEDVRRQLSKLEVQDIPEFLRTLESRGTPFAELAAWIADVREVLAAIEGSHLADAQRHVDVTKLNAAFNLAGESPLAKAATDASLRLDEAAANEFIEEATRTVNDTEGLLAVAGITRRVDIAARITRTQALFESYQRLLTKTSAPLFRTLRPDALADLDERMNQCSSRLLINAVTRWAELAKEQARSVDHIDADIAMMRTWTHVRPRGFLTMEVQPPLRRARAEIEIDALVQSERIEDALGCLEREREWFSGSSYQTQKGRLERRRAVTAYRKGEETVLVEAVRRWGADRDLVGLLVEHFRTTGVTAHLAQVAAHVTQDFDDRDAAAVAQWSRLFENGELDILVTELAGTKCDASLITFLAALPRTASHLAALRVVTRLSPSFSQRMPAVWKELNQAREALTQLHRSRVLEFERRLSEIDAAFDVKHIARRDEWQTATELVQRIGATLTTAMVSVDKMKRQTEEISGYVEAARFLNESSTVETQAREILGRLRHSELFLADFDQAWKNVMRDGWQHVPAFFEIVSGQPTVSANVVRTLCRLALEYSKNHQVILKDVNELVEHHAAGARGFSLPQLDAVVRRIEHESRYDFRPEHDRFKLSARFGGKTWADFRHELADMVAEVNTVEAYEHRLNNMENHIGERIRRCVKNLDPYAAGRQMSEEAARKSLNAELAKPLDGPTAMDLFNDQPAPRLSSAAQDMMASVRRSPTFKMLERAMMLARSHGSPGER